MSYCLNPNCNYPDDPMNGGRKFCRNCGESLLINNRYRIIKQLGKGSFSRTFEVVENKRTYVLKVLNLYRFHNKKIKNKVISLFQREALVLQTLDHPGIPKVNLDGYFEVSYPKSSEPLYCLVMEKIEGLNLQQWLENHQNEVLSVEEAYEWLKQLLEILEKVHEQGYFHRDIKPANIMIRPNGQLVLIDFGAVRDLAQTYLQHQEAANATQIGSPGYAPHEQMHHGTTVAQSDFFALARTFVHLVTKVHPLEIPKAQDNQKLIWKNKLIKKHRSNQDFLRHLRWYNFCMLLDSMMESYWRRRPKNIQSILKRLEDNFVIFLIPYRVIISLTILLAGVSGTYWYLTGVNGCSRIPLRTFPLNDGISCGEEVLVKSSGQTRVSSTEKIQGIDAIRKGNYSQGFTILESAWKKNKNPETLIYLNNAKVETQRVRYHTIAVVAPISNNPDSINSSLEILKGVAQAQDEFNRVNMGKKGVGIKVLIASDNNSPDGAQKIARKLVKKQDVIAVIGHFTSDTTIKAVDIYQENNLLLISPTSTSEDLGLICENIDTEKCFFRRVVGSDRVTARKIAEYLINRTSSRKAAIFFNENSNYSQSIETEFRKEFIQRGGEVVKKINLHPNNFKTDVAMEQVRDSKADVLVMLPNSDGFISNNIIRLIIAAGDQYPIVGGDGLYNYNILEAARNNPQGLIVAIPWHHQSSPNLEFAQNAQKTWREGVSWRTAMTYDAANALLKTVENLPTSASRQDVLRALNKPQFRAVGATGEITFDRKGIRKEQNIYLFKVVWDEKNKLRFVRLGE